MYNIHFIKNIMFCNTFFQDTLTQVKTRAEEPAIPGWTDFRHTILPAPGISTRTFYLSSQPVVYMSGHWFLSVPSQTRKGP